MSRAWSALTVPQVAVMLRTRRISCPLGNWAIMSGPGRSRSGMQTYSTVTLAAAATAFQMAMSFWMKAANSSGVLPTVCIA